MTKLEKILGLTLLVCIFGLGVVNLLSNNSSVGAYVDAGQVSTFTDVNVTNDLVVDGILTADDAVISDDITVTGDLTTTGTTTFSGASAVAVDTTTSTIKIGKTGDGLAPGCLVLGSSTATASPVYITATGATITASTTKPAICR